jgi:hypothetical protein
MRRFFAIWVRSQTLSFSIHCTGAMVEAVAVADRCADSTHCAAHAERHHQVKLPVIHRLSWPSQMGQWSPVLCQLLASQSGSMQVGADAGVKQ